MKTEPKDTRIRICNMLVPLIPFIQLKQKYKSYLFFAIARLTKSTADLSMVE